MSAKSCHIRNLRAGALSKFIREEDARAADGQYLSPDATGWLDAAGLKRLCVVCENCGGVVDEVSGEDELTCPACGDDTFRVIQTPRNEPPKPKAEPITPEVLPPKKEAPPPKKKDDDADGKKGCGCLIVLAVGLLGVILVGNDVGFGWILFWVLALAIKALMSSVK